MARPISQENQNKWALPPEQKVFLAVLLLVLVVFYCTIHRSFFLPSHDDLSNPSRTPNPFVVEIDGTLLSPAIHTFPTQVGITEVLLKAGISRQMIPSEDSVPPLRNGTRIVLSQSHEGLDIRIESMDAAKKILYALPLDLNGVEADELTLIPGIGPTLAKRIVGYRDAKGRFNGLEELLNISGIGRKKVRSLRRYLFVENGLLPNP